jgi:hypothetical protein
MGVRLTGISTPVGGVSWEYTKGAERSAPLSIFPRQKIQVFISSICGVEKYDKVRDELKTAIERTQLADVYTFESKEASTLPAGNHYTWALEDVLGIIFGLFLPCKPRLEVGEYCGKGSYHTCIFVGFRYHFGAVFNAPVHAFSAGSVRPLKSGRYCV